MTISIPKGKVRSPWMGVNVTGARPLALSTELVRGALAGVTVTDCAILQANGNGKRGLRVSFTHGRGHGRTVFYDCGSATVRLGIRQWAEGQRARIAKQGNGDGLTPKARKVAVIVRRLEKEKRQLYVHRPVHPLLPRESHIYEGSDRYLRESELRWHDEKPRRKQLAHIAALALKGKVTNTVAYKLLRDAGFQFEKFSDLRKHDRDRLPWQDDYWRHIHTCVHGMLAKVARAKEYVRDADEGTEFDRHRRAQREYIADRRQAESLDAQIESLRGLAA